MELKQIYTPGLAQLSYVMIGKTSCIVVDPARDAAQYIKVSENIGLPITAIIETHLHADFISGHIELANLTGAKIYISKKARAAFPHYGISDGEEIRIDKFLIKMIDTPGHTPEGSVFIVSDLERGPAPTLIFSGDTLLIGDAGRPDLFPDIKEELAAALYNSLRRIENIGDYVEVYPAHGAGSLCGKKLSAKLSSTIGTERLYNGPMNSHPEKNFIEQLLFGMPEVPDHFGRCSETNRLGPTATAYLPKPQAYKIEKFCELLEQGYLVVDTRDQLAFGAAHIPGAYGLSLKGNFATFSGWVLPAEKPILLIVESKNDLESATKGLYSVGLDNVEGYLDGGMASWAAKGLKTARLESISIEELKRRHDNDELVLVDTRLKSEYDSMHISRSIHCAAPDVRFRFKEWEDSSKPIAFICNSGNRSLLAASLMLRLGNVDKVINVIGGTTAWQNMGYPVNSEGK